MKMSGEQLIPAPRMRVWEALNDPEVLKQSIPGCQELVKNSPTDFAAKVTAKVGPVKANFAGNVTLSDINAPESYMISGQGKGGAAGFAQGGAHVRLEEADGGTRMVYDVDAQVGGKLAQIGNRLIDSTARKMADDFFRRFNAVVTGREPEPAAEAVVEPAPGPAVEPSAEPQPAPGPAVEPSAEPQPAAQPARKAKAPAKKSAAKKPAKKPAKKAAKKTPATGKTKAASTRRAGKSANGAGRAEEQAAGQEMQAPPSLMPEAAVAVSGTNKDEGKTPENATHPFWSGNGVWWIFGAAILGLIVLILATS